jgi:23S rRNA (guanosine2251-2'-O)-methyltransferase
MRRQGWQCLCAGEKGDRSIQSADLSRGPIAWVIGNEARGIREEILQQADLVLRIDQHGHIGSLNAAISAGIVLYETRRQQGPPGCA